MKDFMVIYNNSEESEYNIVRWINSPFSNNNHWQEIYREMFAGRACSNSIGSFRDITELDRYCFKIIQHYNLPGIGLLEREKYNRIIEGVHNFQELKEGLLKKCDYIENPEYKKAGILQRLLN